MTQPVHPADFRLRALQQADLREAAALSARAFGVDVGDRELAEGWLSRVAHPLSSDPEGCFVAEREGSLIGVAEAPP